ncbi:glycosyltransferase family 4 protein [uncultured Cyclobacterium sp.]|uniref:glycosyltransferase family 4 protein n=1 Tax=uncultured Cyclobacterium sp. TaxID=453820 RepID=UPI0030EF2186|tara:strand:+ start:136134 stop:137117 length:984 start_codon:yes stop_codon:yes gene_type:complete
MIKTLYITNMYPTRNHPVDGIFIQEQILEIANFIPLKKEIFLIDAVHKGKLEYIKSIYTISKTIQSKTFDIIHIHYGISGLFLLFFKPKPKVFLTLHGSDIQRRKTNKWQVWLTKIILPKIDKVFVQNQFMKELVKPYNSNVEVITCGVDTFFFKPDSQANKQKNYKLILFPSSPNREVKNYPLFIKIFNRIKEKSSFPVEFACIDKLNRTEVRNLLSRADCLLLTSKTEGSPQVVKEALSCNLPVVSVPVGDVNEIISGIPNCYVGASHQVEEMSDLVIRVFKAEKKDIRNVFLQKEEYDYKSIAHSISAHYLQSLEKTKIPKSRI